MTERMNLNMEDLEMVNGGKESFLDKLCNKAKEIGGKIVDTAGEVDLAVKTKYVEGRQMFNALFD